jgi:hypothetical protein
MQNMDTTKRSTLSQSSAPGLPGQIVASRTMEPDSASLQMSGLIQVERQIADLRQTLNTLMMDKQHADGGVVSASAVLDAQLEDYSRAIRDKKRPGMMTF